MLSVKKTSQSLDFVFDSRGDLIERVLQKAELFFIANGVGEPSKEVLILKELLTNALIHGNHSLPGRKISCKILTKESSGFVIEVEDEGSGFDFRNLNLSIPEDLSHINRRGYILINALSDGITFKNNGRHITVNISS